MEYFQSIEKFFARRGLVVSDIWTPLCVKTEAHKFSAISQ
jgi:hypothetical protein